MSGSTQPAAVLEVPTNEALRRRRAGSLEIEASLDLFLSVRPLIYPKLYPIRSNTTQNNSIQLSPLLLVHHHRLQRA